MYYIEYEKWKIVIGKKVWFSVHLIVDNESVKNSIVALCEGIWKPTHKLSSLMLTIQIYYGFDGRKCKPMQKNEQKTKTKNGELYGI